MKRTHSSSFFDRTSRPAYSNDIGRSSPAESGQWTHCSAEPKPRLPHLNERLFTSYWHGRDSLEECRIDYNLKHPHTSLGGLTNYQFVVR
jgi:Integrase core domain